MTFNIIPQSHVAEISKFALGLERIGRRFLILVLAQVMLAMPLSADAMLPTPLSEFDAAQYLRLFDLQQQGNMKQATREMGRLEKSLL